MQANTTPKLQITSSADYCCQDFDIFLLLHPVPISYLYFFCSQCIQGLCIEAICLVKLLSSDGWLTVFSAIFIHYTSGCPLKGADPCKITSSSSSITSSFHSWCCSVSLPVWAAFHALAIIIVWSFLRTRVMSSRLNPIRLTRWLFRESNRKTAVSLLIYYLGITSTRRTSFAGDLKVFVHYSYTHAITVAFILEWKPILASDSLIMIFVDAHKPPRVRLKNPDKHFMCINVTWQWLL